MANPYDYRRKSPDEILKELKRLERGQWTLYIGSAPGVGKTYRMLQEAHDIRKEGIDVVIGLIETHNREETAALIGDLEQLPLKEMEYKGKTFKEMDLDEILKRNPEVVLIDELAHTNIPGSKNEKRYMDVEDILNKGISVLSAVNIQHFESVHDIVQQISGVKVRERIPDLLLDQADEVILIDTTPELLQKRLKEGKIYDRTKVEQALNHFFTKNNLGALRELALRQVADDVDERMERLHQDKNTDRLVSTNEKIMVCVSYDKNAERLIRRGWRIANRLKAKLFVFTSIHQPYDKQALETQTVIERSKKLAEDFDATFILEITNGRKIPKVITDVAKEHNITQVVLGQSAKSRWEEIRKGSIVNNIMRYTNGIDIHIVSDLY